jgi:acylphosphatase
MTQKAHLSAKANGRVQGVCFRYFVRELGRSLGLTGYARNLPSGDAVEIQAEGEKEQLEKLMEQIRIGPPGARVTGVETSWADFSGQFSNFDIRY